MSQATDLSPAADPGEVEIITFDFGPMLSAGETISGTPVITPYVVQGKAVASSGNLSGSPSVVASPGTGAANSAVQQKVGAMVGGSTYQYQCVAVTSAGQTLSLRVNLPCAVVP